SACVAAVGGVLPVPDRHWAVVTRVSGSVPAYFFRLVEALVDDGVGVGLSRQVATDLAAQTMAGSAAMLLERMDQDQGGANGELMGLRVDLTASRLRAAVTSPGGTTAAALRELERGGFRMAVDAAVQAAKSRSEQLRITPE
ncbi:pyrroline-5-carboxylate reductase dimerization domain-containing protein, partial [Mycobacterium tuberculosis]